MANEMQRGAEVGRGMEGASNVCEAAEAVARNVPCNDKSHRVQFGRRTKKCL